MSLQSFTLVRPSTKWAAPGALPQDSAIVADAHDLKSVLAALNEAERRLLKQEEHIRQLENMTVTDELTGLLNRRGFVHALEREMAMARRDVGATGILVMIDLDGFKSVNDTHGHAVGDAYLRAVATMLAGNVRASDIVARLGGDEFAVLFTRMSAKYGASRVARLEKAFNGKQVSCGDKMLTLRASFGLASFAGIEAPEAVLADADLKLYAHKAIRRGA